MDIIELSKYEDVFYYILKHLDNNDYINPIQSISQLSKYFKNYIDTYIDKNKKLSHTINFNDYGLLQKWAIDNKNIVRWSKMVVFTKYKYENNNQILTFLMNNFILDYINKYHIWEKQKITHNLNQLDKLFKKTRDTNVRHTISKNKNVKNETLKIIKYEIFKIKKCNDDNYTSLLIMDHPNYGILRLAFLVKNMMIFDLTKISNVNTLKKLNELHRFEYKSYSSKRQAILYIQSYISSKQYSLLYGYFMNI